MFLQRCYNWKDLGDGDNMQVPCKLIFSGVKKCIDVLQKQIK